MIEQLLAQINANLAETQRLQALLSSAEYLDPESFERLGNEINLATYNLQQSLHALSLYTHNAGARQAYLDFAKSKLNAALLYDKSKYDPLVRVIETMRQGAAAIMIDLLNNYMLHDVSDALHSLNHLLLIPGDKICNSDVELFVEFALYYRRPELLEALLEHHIRVDNSATFNRLYAHAPHEMIMLGAKPSPEELRQHQNVDVYIAAWENNLHVSIENVAYVVNSDPNADISLQEHASIRNRNLEVLVALYTEVLFASIAQPENKALRRFVELLSRVPAMRDLVPGVSIYEGPSIAPREFEKFRLVATHMLFVQLLGKSKYIDDFIAILSLSEIDAIKSIKGFVDDHQNPIVNPRGYNYSAAAIELQAALEKLIVDKTPIPINDRAKQAIFELDDVGFASLDITQVDLGVLYDAIVATGASKDIKLFLHAVNLPKELWTRLAQNSKVVDRYSVVLDKATYYSECSNKLEYWARYLTGDLDVFDSIYSGYVTNKHPEAINSFLSTLFKNNTYELCKAVFKKIKIVDPEGYTLAQLTDTSEMDALETFHAVFACLYTSKMFKEKHAPFKHIRSAHTDLTNGLVDERIFTDTKEYLVDNGGCLDRHCSTLNDLGWDDAARNLSDLKPKPKVELRKIITSETPSARISKAINSLNYKQFNAVSLAECEHDLIVSALKQKTSKPVTSTPSAKKQKKKDTAGAGEQARILVFLIKIKMPYTMWCNLVRDKKIFDYYPQVIDRLLEMPARTFFHLQYEIDLLSVLRQSLWQVDNSDEIILKVEKRVAEGLVEAKELYQKFCTKVDAATAETEFLTEAIEAEIGFFSDTKVLSELYKGKTLQMIVLEKGFLNIEALLYETPLATRSDDGKTALHFWAEFQPHKLDRLLNLLINYNGLLLTVADEHLSTERCWADRFADIEGNTFLHTLLLKNTEITCIIALNQVLEADNLYVLARAIVKRNNDGFNLINIAEQYGMLELSQMLSRVLAELVSDSFARQLIYVVDYLDAYHDVFRTIDSKGEVISCFERGDYETGKKLTLRHQEFIDHVQATTRFVISRHFVGEGRELALLNLNSHLLNLFGVCGLIRSFNYFIAIKDTEPEKAIRMLDVFQTDDFRAYFARIKFVGSSQWAQIKHMFSPQAMVTLKLYYTLGLDFVALNDDGVGVLSDAAYIKNFDIFRYLHERFELEITRLCLFSVVSKATATDMPFIRHVLAEFKKQSPDVNIKEIVDPTGRDLLHSALLNGACTDVMEYLVLEQGFNINKISGDASQSLIMRRMREKAPVDELLFMLVLGVDHSHCDSADAPVMYYMVDLYDHTALISAYLEAGADISPRKHDSCTVLHLTARKNRPEVTEVLLKHAEGIWMLDSVINKPDKDGITPLHAAAGAGSPKIAKLLLEYGADSTKKDKQFKKSAYELARKLHGRNAGLLKEFDEVFGSKNNSGDKLRLTG